MATSSSKKTREEKELEAAALMALAQRLEGRLSKLTRALDSLKKKAKSILGGKKKST